MAVVNLEEYKRLQNVVLELESLLAGSPKGAVLLANCLHHTKKQIEALKHEISEEQEKIQADRAAAVAEAVRQETVLNENEQGIFGDLLQK